MLEPISRNYTSASLRPVWGECGTPPTSGKTRLYGRFQGEITLKQRKVCYLIPRWCRMEIACLVGRSCTTIDLNIKRIVNCSFLPWKIPCGSSCKFNLNHSRVRFPFRTWQCASSDM